MLPWAVESLSLEASTGPKHRRLYESLRDAILDGSLAPETRLPATRLLAEHLGVSRNTVVTAFEQLRAEGYVTAKVGHGTRVAAIAPENLIAAAPAPMRANRPDAGALKPVRPLRRFGPFEPGQPDVHAFPHGLWARLLARSARGGERLAVPYEEPMGDPALQSAIATHISEYRGVRCHPDQVLITTSVQAGLAMIAGWFLEPGAAVWLEEPGYFGALRVFRNASATVVPVPVDAEGLDPDAAPGGSTAPRLIYVTPSHQFPLGITMPLPRRLALLERAARIGAYIVEDDYDSEFRFSGRPVAALQSLDSAGRVIYMGTFSKTLMPGMRVGYLVLPEQLAAPLRESFQISALQPPAVVQAALAQFINEGHYAAHIRRMRTIYASRLAALTVAADALPRSARLARCSTGLQVPLFLPPSIDDIRLAKRGVTAGLSLNALSKFYLGGRPRKGLLLGFAAMPERDMARHVGTLARLLGDSGRDGWNQSASPPLH